MCKCKMMLVICVREDALLVMRLYLLVGLLGWSQREYGWMLADNNNTFV